MNYKIFNKSNLPMIVVASDIANSLNIEQLVLFALQEAKKKKIFFT